MSIVTKQKKEPRHHGAIADIVSPVGKVSMVGKCLLRSVCYEVTSFFYYFVDDINVLFLHFCLKFVMLLCIVVHDSYQRNRK